MSQIPKIPAYEDPITHFLSFKCPWCNKVHHHGMGLGTRQSHCRIYDGEYELVQQEEKCSV